MVTRTKPLVSHPHVAATVSRRSRLALRVSDLAPGLVLVLGLSLTAQLLALAQEQVLGRAWIEGLVLALLLGVLVGNSGLASDRFDAGAAYAGKHVLELAVVLLGAGINASTPG